MLLRVLALCWLLLVPAFAGGLEKYPSLVAADPRGQKPLGICITYLGTNGYQFQWKGHSLVVDPYLDRAGFARVIFGLPLKTSPAPTRWALAKMAPKADAVLVTHGHCDHALNVSEVMQTTGARLYASATTVKLAELDQAPPGKSKSLRIGQTVQAGPWRITALEARHDCIFGLEPYPGEAKKNTRPVRASDWRMGTPLAFLIEAGGQRIYIDSGGRLDGPLPAIGKVDLAIIGVALKDARARLPAILKNLQPRYFLPSHQDDFFRPLSQPFRFGASTDFPAVLRVHREQALPGRLILLDYFRPWTLR